MSSSKHEVALSPQWLAAVEWLRCPTTGAKFVADGQRLVSRDAATRLAYQVRDEVPELLPGCGVVLPLEEWQTVMTRHP